MIRFLFAFIFLFPTLASAQQVDPTPANTVKVEFKSDTANMEVIFTDAFKVRQVQYVVKYLVQGQNAEPVERQMFVFNERKKVWELKPNADQYVVWFRKK